MTKRPFRSLSIFASFAILGGAVADVGAIAHAQGAEVRSDPSRAVSPQRDPAEMADHLTQKLDERLNLSDEQADQVRTIVERAARELRETREKYPRRSPEARAAREGIFETAYGQVSELLDPEQRAELDRLRDEQIAKWEQRREEQRQRQQQPPGSQEGSGR